MFEGPGCLFLAKREGSRGFLLSLICQMSNVKMSKCQTSNVKRQMSKCQTSKCQMSKCQTSKCQMSNVKCQTSNVKCQTSNVKCQMSKCQMSKCQTSNVKCPFVSTPERERSAPSLGGDSHRPRRERGPYRGARRTKFHFVLLVPRLPSHYV